MGRGVVDRIALLDIACNLCEMIRIRYHVSMKIDLAKTVSLDIALSRSMANYRPLMLRDYARTENDMTHRFVCSKPEDFQS